jgi:hypothetical protein
MHLHRPRHPSSLGALDVREFLTSFAVTGQVSAGTQNQALAAVRFLYDHVLSVPIAPVDGVVRAKRPARLPVVRHGRSRSKPSNER